jgi:hypothetical protein
MVSFGCLVDGLGIAETLPDQVHVCRQSLPAFTRTEVAISRLAPKYVAQLQQKQVPNVASHAIHKLG